MIMSWRTKPIRLAATMSVPGIQSPPAGTTIPKMSAAGSAHSQERRLPVEPVLGSHDAPRCSGVALTVAAEDRALISRTPGDRSVHECRPAEPRCALVTR